MDRDRHGDRPPPQRQQQQDRGERREFNRDPRDIEERMPKLKPSEGAVRIPLKKPFLNVSH